jgi:hypothetical protein
VYFIYFTTPVVGWYNGDPSDRYVGSQFGLGLEPWHVYDSFVVPEEGWTVVGLFANVWATGSAAPLQQALWEIRRNCALGDSGEPVAYGVSSVQAEPTGAFSLHWGTGFKIVVSGLDLKLPKGRYWMTVAPGTMKDNPHIGYTSGKNGVGLISEDIPLVARDHSGRIFVDAGIEMLEEGHPYFFGFSQGVLISRW